MKQKAHQPSMFAVNTMDVSASKHYFNTPLTHGPQQIDLSDYHIDRNIGNGQYGNVFRAIHYRTEKQYALKIILTHNKSKALKDALDEVHAHSCFSHHNIVQLIGYQQEQGKVGLLMEYADKGNLFQYIQRRGSLNEFEAHDFFMQVVNGIKYLHSNNYIHRDIKPENILRSGNIIKICDFGGTVKLDDPKIKNAYGTFEYVAPETISKREYSTATDIWALGILLYELVHGKAPFRSTENGKLLYKIQHDTPIYKKGLSAGLLQVLDGLLAKQPQQRWTIQKLYDSQWMKQTFTPNKSEFHHFILNLRNGKKLSDYNEHNCTLSTSIITPTNKSLRDNTTQCSSKALKFKPVVSHTNSFWEKMAYLITD
jgi:serine/threonine protein kinase